MVDISDSKLKQLFGKSWSSWNLPCSATEHDIAKIREANRPKEPDKKLAVNMLPLSLKQLYGNRPDVEYYSVSRCPGCKLVMKTLWLARHYKRDSYNNLVCRRTEMLVAGGKCLGKATSPLYDIKESSKNLILMEFENSTLNSQTSSGKHTLAEPVVVTTRTSPLRSKSSSSSHHKTESSSSKSKSSSSHSKKSSSSLSSKDKDRDHKESSSSSSRHKSSKSHSNSSSYSSSSSRRDRDRDRDRDSSSKTHKSISSTASYVLSIPSDDTGHHDSMDSILLSNSSSRSGMHVITMSGSKKNEPEYEQLKFYADASDKKSKGSSHDSEHKSSKHSSSFSQADGTTFKIPLKSKSSSASTGHSSSSHSESKKSSSKSHSHSHHSSKSSSSSHDTKLFKSSSSNSSSKSSATSSISNIESKEKEKHSSSSSSHAHVPSTPTPEVKEKSHSKKKKKKKDKDEPRKVIPLKERAFHPDQHCGVVVSEHAQPCTRSLTCKTHSIALRRAVPGRSQGFDSLLAAHKKARDEEKNAKVKEVVNEIEMKAKIKKSSSHTTVASAEVDTHIHHISDVKHINSHSHSSKSVSSKSHHSVTTTPTVTPVAVSTPTPTTVNTTAKSASVSVASAPPHPKATISISQPTVQPRHQPKPAAIKVSNRPVRVVENRKELPGTSLFDIEREPENNFVFVSRVVPPTPTPITINPPEDSKSSRNSNNALSEWNPLDRLGHKTKAVKRKNFKDPLVKIPAKRSLVRANSKMETDSEESEQSTATAAIDKPSTNTSKSRIMITPTTSRRNSSVVDDGSQSQSCSKDKPGNLVTPNQFYISMYPTHRQDPLVLFAATPSSDDDEANSQDSGYPVPDYFVLTTAAEMVSADPEKLEESPTAQLGLGSGTGSTADNINVHGRDLAAEAKEFLANVIWEDSQTRGTPCDSVDCLKGLPARDLANRMTHAINSCSIV